MAKLSISEFSVLTRVGDNRRPISGYVTFSDGKDYGWHSDLDSDAIEFHGRRGHEGFKESFYFKSSKRALLVKDWLENNG